MIYLEGGRFCDGYTALFKDRSPDLTKTLPEVDGAMGAMPHGGLASNDPTRPTRRRSACGRASSPRR